MGTLSPTIPLTGKVYTYNYRLPLTQYATLVVANGVRIPVIRYSSLLLVEERTYLREVAQ